MKRLNYCLLGLGILLAVVGCTKTQTQSKNEIPVVDVTKNYPKKEIVLQDIAEVDYIPLETRNDVLIDNNYRLCVISPDSIWVGNEEEGTIFLFNGQGKILQKFNHKGQSGKEYQNIWGLYYDNPTQEIIVLDYIMKYQLQVYDKVGNYKKTIPIPKKYSLLGADIINFDENLLLCYKNGEFSNFSFNGGFADKSDSVKKEIKPYFFLSKKDGKELGDLPISLPEKIETTITKKKGNSISITSVRPTPFVPKGNNLILSEVGKDTIFEYSKDKKLTPLVARTPEILKMDEPLVFLQVEKIIPQYVFGKVTKKGTDAHPKFTEQKIVIDRATNEVADMLKELLEAGKLKGKLKDIAEKIKEDDNPVWVRVKFKNN